MRKNLKGRLRQSDWIYNFNIKYARHDVFGFVRYQLMNFRTF